MVECGEDFGFPLEPGQARRIGRDRIRKHLDGDGPLQARVGSPINLTHAAHANLSSNFVRA
jgi:hypothetical protein